MVPELEATSAILFYTLQKRETPAYPERSYAYAIKRFVFDFFMYLEICKKIYKNSKKFFNIAVKPVVVVSTK